MEAHEIETNHLFKRGLDSPHWNPAGLWETHQPVLVTWTATDSAMGLLNIFTVGELVAITMVVLQLVLVTVTLRDKCLWRIRQNLKHPSAARGWLEGQSNVDRARRSADMGLPHGSSPCSFMSSGRRFPRYAHDIQSSGEQTEHY
ncbi:uncharacterized protein M8220_000835 isoform 2-T4 [Acridotheres tristis]